MNTFNHFYRKSGKSPTHEILDAVDTGLRKRSRTSGWEFPQLPGHENQFGGLSDAEEPDTDIDVATSQKSTDAVFSYLSVIGPIRVLTREEEHELAKSIANDEAQIAVEASSSLLALHWALDVGKKVASGLVDAGMDDHSPGPEANAVSLDLQRYAQRILATLSPREEKIVRMRFGIGEKAEHTLEETGKIFGVTRERIRQIESAALKKLRHPRRGLANPFGWEKRTKDINGFLTKEET